MSDCKCNSGENKGFWSGLFLGGLLGAGLIVFLQTKEGKKIAQELMEKGEELTDELQDKIEDVGQKAEEIKGEVTDQTMAKLDTALAKLEEAQVKAQETTEVIRKRFFTKAGKKLS